MATMTQGRHELGTAREPWRVHLTLAAISRLAMHYEVPIEDALLMAVNYSASARTSGGTVHG